MLLVTLGNNAKLSTEILPLFPFVASGQESIEKVLKKVFSIFSREANPSLDLNLNWRIKIFSRAKLRPHVLLAKYDKGRFSKSA